MEKIAFVTEGHSDFDDDVWAILPSNVYMYFNEYEFTHGSQGDINNEYIVLDYFGYIQLFILSGASIINKTSEVGMITYEVVVEDKKKFLNELKKNIRKYCYRHITEKQIRYVKYLLKFINNDPERNKEIFDGFFEKVELRLKLDGNILQQEAAQIITFLSSIEGVIKGEIELNDEAENKEYIKNKYSWAKEYVELK